MVKEIKGDYFLYWIEEYVKGYRKGVSHASNDGHKTLCNREITMKWDGGHHDLNKYNVECKLCSRKIEALSNL